MQTEDYCGNCLATVSKQADFDSSGDFDYYIGCSGSSLEINPTTNLGYLGSRCYCSSCSCRNFAFGFWGVVSWRVVGWRVVVGMNLEFNWTESSFVSTTDCRPT